MVRAFDFGRKVAGSNPAVVKEERKKTARVVGRHSMGVSLAVRPKVFYAPSSLNLLIFVSHAVLVHCRLTLLIFFINWYSRVLIHQFRGSSVSHESNNLQPYHVDVNDRDLEVWPTTTFIEEVVPTSYLH